MNSPWEARKSPHGASRGTRGISNARLGSRVQVLVWRSPHLCAASVGEDTGGSGRGPASYCSVVGLRPTFTRVSRYGMTPMCWYLDTAAPLTGTVQDCALILGAIAGYDPRDPLPVVGQCPITQPASVAICKAYASAYSVNWTTTLACIRRSSRRSTTRLRYCGNRGRGTRGLHATGGAGWSNFWAWLIPKVPGRAMTSCEPVLPSSIVPRAHGCKPPPGTGQSV